MYLFMGIWKGISYRWWRLASNTCKTPPHVIVTVKLGRAVFQGLEPSNLLDSSLLITGYY
jgi:hypothetical protein